MSISYLNEEHRKRCMKSFSAFLVEQQYITRNGKFVCMECNGLGQVVADYEQPDPCEGYKMADRVPCPSCNGTKYTTEKVYRDYFKKVQSEYRQKEKELKRINNIRIQALKKLTKEEQFALGIQ